MSQPHSITDGYTACHDSAALAEWANFALLRVSGPDRYDYLNRLTTNRIQAAPGRGVQAFLLSVNGRPIVETWVWDEGDSCLLEVPRELTERTLAELDKYHFAEKLEFQDLASSYTGLAVLGPKAREQLGLQALEPRRIAAFGESGVQCSLDRLACPGDVLWMPQEEADALVREAGLERLGADLMEVLRIEAGYPIYGQDYDQETLFLEMASRDAYSENKGCYPGQEMVARILHRGRVNRRIRGFSLLGEGSLAPGARALMDGKEVARVTSAAVSPVRGALGLGYVRREHYQAGSELELEDGSKIRVEEPPFARG